MRVVGQVVALVGSSPLSEVTELMLVSYTVSNGEMALLRDSLRIQPEAQEVLELPQGEISAMWIVSDVIVP